MTSLGFKSYHGTRQTAKCCVCFEDKLAKECFFCNYCVDGITCKDCAYAMDCERIDVLKFETGSRKQEIQQYNYEAKKLPSKCPCCRKKSNQDAFLSAFGQVGVRYVKYAQRIKYREDEDYIAYQQQYDKTHDKITALALKEKDLKKRREEAFEVKRNRLLADKYKEEKGLEELIGSLNKQLNALRNDLWNAEEKIKEECEKKFGDTKPEYDELCKKASMLEEHRTEAEYSIRYGLSLPKSGARALVDKLTAQERAELLQLLSAK